MLNTITYTLKSMTPYADVTIVLAIVLCSLQSVTSQVTCGAGEFVATSDAGNDICRTCPQDTYKTGDLASATLRQCIACPDDSPRTLMTGATTEADCTYGMLYLRHSDNSL